jgi:uncharacterized protein YkwD
MKICSFFIRSFLFTLLIMGSVQPVNAEQLNYLSPLENAVIQEINMARSNPKGYASFLEEWKWYYDGRLLKLPGERIILTKEGATAVNEAMSTIRSMNPVARLSPSRGMSLGARDHVRDQGSSGSIGHRGRDGSTVWERVNRYGTWEKSVAENISYGSNKARNIVMELIIDDGIPGRGHRKNIFNPDFRVIGVACGYHETYGTVCVITFAGGYNERGGK